jgi:hypothetical protein
VRKYLEFQEERNLGCFFVDVSVVFFSRKKNRIILLAPLLSIRFNFNDI